MIFDNVKAEKAVQFFEKYLTHTDGEWAGKPFILLPWQKELIMKIYGTVKKNGLRQYTTVYVEIPKKNGKSGLASGIALKGLLADNEPGAQVFSAAADKEQASIVFNTAVQMIMQNKILKKRCKVIPSTKRIIIPKTNSTYKVLSKESKTKHGLNISTVVIDELHVVPTELFDILTQGSGDARRQPLFFYITTAGNDKKTKCWELHNYALQILNGTRNDPYFLPVIFAADENENWEDEKTWYKANPSLDATIDIEKVRKAYHDAKERPSEESAFRQLRLNQWVANESKWLRLADFKKCKVNNLCKIDNVTLDNLKGRDCYIGIDLSSTTDITAICYCFPDYEADKYFMFWDFYIPKENMIKRCKKDKVPYDLWVNGGYIKATEGNIIDYRYIKKDLLEKLAGFELTIREIAYDPYNSSQIVIELQDEGFEMVQFRQGFISMNPACKEFETGIIKQELQYIENPVIEWMIDNVVIAIDPAGNIKPDKKKSTERIDGVVAAVMALNRALINRGQKKKSVYEERGIISLVD